jgi:eukaryotic-like serine/threonine-protein kinase
MEFVDGVPITKYCDEHRLSVQERIELFIQVCEAVQHAHQKAIIHRDLKPSNVLVREQDGKAQPKIIDFGLAKAMGQNRTEATMFTQLGTVVGTPAYMSPEQAGAQAADIDTRTDVYSLGVLLYELLVGVTPMGDAAKLPFDELLRNIRESDAARPSTRIQKFDDQTQTSLAEHRNSKPVAPRRQLGSDLDWIALKALEKDRERRYHSAAEFADDLERYLKNEPVIARPPSAAYRWGKFVRRHRLGVGFAASVGLLLIAFAITMAIQTVRIARQRDIAEKNRAEATKQAQLALDTIYQVVTSADEQLKDVAGTGQLRKVHSPPRLFPCLRFAVSLAVAAQDSGPSGSLLLTCKNFAFSASCRFIPAHKNRLLANYHCAWRCHARSPIASVLA